MTLLASVHIIKLFKSSDGEKDISKGKILMISGKNNVSLLTSCFNSLIITNFLNVKFSSL